MSTNKKQKGGSVKVILYFLAFVVLCVSTPIMIDDLVRQEQTAQQRIMHGEDPTAVLEATSAGDPANTAKCNVADYVYGRSSDGYAFIQRINTNLYAVDVVGVTKHYIMDQKSRIGLESKEGTVLDGSDHELTNMLENCIKSGVVPVPADINFGIKH